MLVPTDEWQHFYWDQLLDTPAAAYVLVVLFSTDGSNPTEARMDRGVPLSGVLKASWPWYPYSIYKIHILPWK